MVYNESTREATYLYRMRHRDNIRIITREQVKRHRAKWREYTMEIKRLGLMDDDVFF